MQAWDSRDNGFAVFEVEFAKNKFDKQFANTYDVDSWFADEKGNVIFGIEFNENTNEVTSWFRPDGSKKWQELYTRKAYEGETFAPLFVSGDKAIILTDYELGREAVWQYDLREGKYDNVLFEAEGYDVAGEILSNDRSELLGVYYFDDFRVDHYFDADASQRDELIKSSFPGYKTTITSRSLDEQRMMVSLVSDNLPPKYVWVDLTNKAASTWYSQYPELEGVLMPKVTPIEFDASDGTRLTGYFTMPLRYDGDKPALVVLPHGGPRVRDYQYFNSWVQFLANRGYAVLQVNFRGSEGFGTAHQTAGYRQWGLLMQQDVYDAVDWLAEQELVDMDRKCVVGASYGGYVALTAAYQRPEEYRCIVSIAGISDLYEMARNESLITSNKLGIATEIGDPSDTDHKAMLRENSAVNHIGEIEAPLLVIHGTEDTRVRIAQTRDFFRKAEIAGLDIEYLEIDNGTHFIDENNNRMAVFEALDKFLDKNL
jgi:dipeptidyl aminopeptidase/acylaminoacyl peptidase